MQIRESLFMCAQARADAHVLAQSSSNQIRHGVGCEKLFICLHSCFYLYDLQMKAFFEN